MVLAVTVGKGECADAGNGKRQRTMNGLAAGQCPGERREEPEQDGHQQAMDGTKGRGYDTQPVPY
jgi:hypothetical protein